MTAYYNEWDPFAAQWLRNLIAANHIAPGEVDERSICDVRPEDLLDFTQCHFFAGIGGWSYALRLARWSDERPVWTGSCPCQPFSVAGRRKGGADHRHLWPEFRRLIEKRRPATVFGEQVANASPWLALVHGDLEKMGYAVGALPIEAASAGAEHFRDRYWFVADRDGQYPGARRLQRGGQLLRSGRDQKIDDGSMGNGSGSGLHAPSLGRIHCGKEGAGSRNGESERSGSSLGLGRLADSDSERSQIALSQSSDPGAQRQTTAGDSLFGVVDPSGLGWREGREGDEIQLRIYETAAIASIDGCEYLECPDGKWRRLPPPGIRWLGTRIPSRVAKLRAYGNAIDPRPAAAFITAFSDAVMECAP